MLKPEFTIRPYSPVADYDTVAAFWRGHGVEPWPQPVMSGLGSVAMLDGKIAAVSLYYATNADLIILAPVVADPELEDRTQALAMWRACEANIERAKADLPNGLIWAMAHNEGVINTFVNRAGFRDTGSVRTAGLANGESFSLDIIDEKG